MSPTAERSPGRAIAAKRTGGVVHLTDDPDRSGPARRMSIYTDTWTSMGQETEAEDRGAYLLPSR